MKVALLGTAPGWERAPWDDLTYEIWGVNDAYLSMLPEELARVSRWFELHGDTPLTRARRPADHFDRLAAFEIPVYTFYDLPGVKTARSFPIDAAVAAGRDYFACTTSYQIALALSEGATAIEIYGAPFLSARESLVERPCVEWWLGLAEGRGVQTKVFHRATHGLQRHAYRYALEDMSERTDVYYFVASHRAWTDGWLSSEELRLGLSSENDVLRPPVEEDAEDGSHGWLLTLREWLGLSRA